MTKAYHFSHVVDARDYEGENEAPRRLIARRL
jgi:hypothetical protein